VDEWFKSQGYDIKSVRDINPRMADREILKIASLEKRMVVTMDKDFGELIYNSKMSHSGVLLLRFEGITSEQKVKVVKNIMNNYSDMLNNKFCVYKSNKLRIRE